MVSPADRACIEYAMKVGSLLLDHESGVYWRFDFEKEEFQVGTVCNTGLIVDIVQKYEAGPSVEWQLSELIEKAKEYYHYEEGKS